MHTKQQLFEIILLELTKWYKQENWNLEKNNLGRLKVLKLLFLVVMNDKNILKIFDNFQARANWPTEKDLYDLIKQDKLSIFGISENTLKIKQNNYNIKDYKQYKTLAKKLVDKLKNKDKNIINLSPSELVDLTKQFSCWRLSREFKQKKIASELILWENFI